MPCQNLCHLMDLKGSGVAEATGEQMGIAFLDGHKCPNDSKHNVLEQSHSKMCRNVHFCDWWEASFLLCYTLSYKHQPHILVYLMRAFGYKYIVFKRTKLGRCYVDCCYCLLMCVIFEDILVLFVCSIICQFQGDINLDIVGNTTWICYK